MHVRGSETEPEFYINGNAVRINEYKDLGVIVDNKLKFTSHINRIVANANSRAFLIHKCFVSRDVPTLVRAFTTYVRPLLEYASCIWSPSYSGAANQIESVQRRFTKRLLGCEQLDYASRLNKLSLHCHELGRLHLDLLLVYKILFGLVDVTATDFFTLLNNSHST